MKVAFLTLGCKVNFYETEQMMEQFQTLGFDVVDFQEKADVYIVNTCTVTNMADRKSRQMLHRAKKKNPDSLVVAVGCYVESGEAKLEEDSAVDAFFSNREKEHMAERFVEQFHLTPKETQTMGSRHVEHERTRAYLKIQDGCNQFCTYCMIPYVRGKGKLVSMPEDEVISHVESLAKQGYKEVVLTGIHLSSYGVDFSDALNFVSLEGKPLLAVISKVAEIEGVERIRLGSLEPRIITESFAKELSAIKKVCPHFHLSLQSGCDTTLERMNRRYRSAEYAEKCGLLRKYLGNPALTTDVIVGFTMETEEDILESYDFVESIHFYETHIFKYSRRHGTKAAAMSGQLTEAQKAVRSDKMLALNEQHAKEYEKSMLGGELKVLLEEEVEINGEQWYIGHSMEYIKTAVKKQDNYSVNDIITVKAEEFLEEHTLTGEVLGVE